ncbi:hypothetical protein PC128_g26645, partial [Phytophthora cactorum]
MNVAQQACNLAVSLIFTFDFNGALTRTKTRYPPPHSNAMDQVTKMLVGLAAMLMAGAVPTNLAEQVPAFEVPNFDYQTLSTGNTPND